MKLSWLLYTSLLTEVPLVQAFQTQSVIRTTSIRFSSSVAAKSLFDGLPELPNPFGKSPESTEPETFEYQSTPAGLLRQAKLVIATDLGLQDPSLLDESFQWIGPTFDQALDKTDYVAAGRFFDLRSAFPDLDFRAHDFRIPQDDDSTVRLTCRVTGTMRGELRLRSGTLPPTGQTMQCPPEAVSMTFVKNTGKVVKLCTGFSMDRQAGNTQGTTGVMAAATIAGQPPSDWELYPPTVVVRRFFGRPVPPLKESKSVLAPFPETVMVQLAKGVLAANMAVEDPTLLANNFEYSTPLVGPVKKKDYLEKYAAAEFADIDPGFSDFRVDLYDPVRVWVDVRPSGPGYEGSPQAMSFTFDEDGFCTRITSGYVMDPSIGNGGGLGGREGYLYATGQSRPGFVTRSLPRSLGRLRKLILSPVTKIGPDEYTLPGSKSVVTPPPPVVTSEKESLSSIRAAVPATPARVPGPPTPESPKVTPKREAPKLEFPKVELPKVPKVELPKAPKAAVKKVPKAPKAATKQTPKPVVKPTPKPVAKQAPKPAAKRTPKPVAKQAPKPVVKQTPKPVAKQAPKPAAKRTPKATTPAPFFAAAKVDVDKKQSEARKKEEQVMAEAERKRKEAAAQKVEAARKQEQARAEAERQRKEAEARKKEQARQKQMAAEKAEAEAKKKEQAEARQRQLEVQKAEAERKKQEKEDQRRKEQEAKKAAAEAKKAEAERKRQEAKEAKAAAAEAKAQKSRQAQAKKQNKTAEAQQKQQEKAALGSLAKAATSATLSLFGLSSPDDEGPAPLPEPSKKTTKRAPRGVPSISRWRKNSDGSVTGLISGSRNFDEGERVTTSPIASGTIAPGEVVRTGSGSRYFLS